MTYVDPHAMRDSCEQRIRKLEPERAAAEREASAADKTAKQLWEVVERYDSTIKELRDERDAAQRQIDGGC